MKAVRLVGWQTEPEVQEVPDPEPGPGEVVVKVGGAGVCHSDLHLIRDFVAGAVPWGPPFTLGHENAGWVHALGAAVTGWEVGQPVAVYGAWGCGRCRRCRLGEETMCENAAEVGTAGGGLGSDGGMAPYLLVPSDRLLVPLADLEPADAAPLTDAGLTPYHAIKRSLSLLTPGSTAVVIGAGGLGHLAIQILKALCPARVVVVDKSDGALSLAADLGADACVSAGDDAAAGVRDAGHGRPADVVFDLVGVDSTMALAAAAVRPGGHVNLVGVAGGTYPWGFFTAPPEAWFASSYWGTITELMEVIALAESGRLKVHTQRFNLEGTIDAYHQLEEGKLIGRGVVVP